METCFWTSQVATCQTSKHEMKFLYQQIPTRYHQLCMPKGTGIAIRQDPTVPCEKGGKTNCYPASSSSRFQFILRHTFLKRQHHSPLSHLLLCCASQSTMPLRILCLQLVTVTFSISSRMEAGSDVHCGAHPRHVWRLGNWKISIGFRCLPSISRKWRMMSEIIRLLDEANELFTFFNFNWFTG